ncbi:hypothetical protein AB0C84_39550 [Actinomadura sp. NPDC048955]|uniref:hypothetical protein n=1 Tax=Actinomadura sp. NPDC048955 TaxID=3158228 RepID=UPI0033DFA3C7
MPSLPYRAVREGGGDKALVLVAGTCHGLWGLLSKQDEADCERALLALGKGLLGLELHPQLAALARRMGVRGYKVDIGAHEVTVATADGGTPRAVRITCEPRPKDDDRDWFWTHWGDPLAQADDITGAEVALVGLLARA